MRASVQAAKSRGTIPTFVVVAPVMEYLNHALWSSGRTVLCQMIVGVRSVLVSASRNVELFPHRRRVLMLRAEGSFVF